jgi:hypothetical protein
MELNSLTYGWAPGYDKWESSCTLTSITTTITLVYDEEIKWRYSDEIVDQKVRLAAINAERALTAQLALPAKQLRDQHLRRVMRRRSRTMRSTRTATRNWRRR